MNKIIKQLVCDIHKLGIMPGDTLLVHSSLRSLGWVDVGAETVIRALIEALPNGTLLMPALSWKLVSKDNPRFSAKNTPSCVGAIPEVFRKHPGVIRSVHPTHSVCAYGVNAEQITFRHYLDRTPVGENSPFRLLTEYKGKILMLGCGLKPNTFMHGVEEAANIPYVLENEATKVSIEDNDGNTEDIFHYRHDFKGIRQRYDRVSECVNVNKGKILNADVLILDACSLWDAAAKKLSEDPWFFVDRESLKEQYLRNPCGALATAFWKEHWFPKPKGINIFLESALSKEDEPDGTRYFRLIHHMEECPEAVLPNGYVFRNVAMPDEAGFVADFINRCYEGYNQTKEKILQWSEYPVFSNDLWVFVWDELRKAPSALGIADYDEALGEGSLEWIQTLPDYRGKGFGEAIVRELLSRLNKRAAFVTVSGEVDNASNPEGLYRKCGFTGDDIWVVTQTPVNIISSNPE